MYGAVTKRFPSLVLYIGVPNIYMFTAKDGISESTGDVSF